MEKDLGGPGGQQLIMSQQWTLMAEVAKSILDCISRVANRWREDILLLNSALLGSSWSAGFSAGLTGTRET